MPTYEYQCKKCGYKFEEFQSMMDSPLKKCPECKGKVKRLIGTGAGVIFKGTGFYETDYKRTSTASKAEKSLDSDSSKDGSSSDKKTDKPASSSSAPPAKSDAGDK